MAVVVVAAIAFGPNGTVAAEWPNAVQYAAAADSSAADDGAHDADRRSDAVVGAACRCTSPDTAVADRWDTIASLLSL